MIIGVGLDVVELDRIKRALERFGTRFSERILSPEELAQVPSNPVPFLSSRFAAKEAASKALGTGFTGGVTFHSLKISSLPSGEPVLTFKDGALERSRALGVNNIFLSITHGRDVAAAVVILER
ncbi:MAG: holo-[acyl-carrier-protein] synthase [Desulfovibrionales bacterium]